MALPKTILIIDDESQIQRLLVNSFSAFDISVISAMTGARGIELAITARAEFILLDIGLPDIDGLNVLKEIRTWSKVPIIILSARDEEDTIVFALENGADDYVTKPFNFRELLARIKLSFLRQVPEANVVFTLEHLEVDFTSRTVKVFGKEISLTSTEYDLLKLFIKHAGKVLTHQQLLKEVWGPNAIESPQYVRVYVGHLRHKIEEIPHRPRLIITETGVGYRMKVQPDEDK